MISLKGKSTSGGEKTRLAMIKLLFRASELIDSR
jgi:ATPase subunit of ABC transporter with duplicated ATPase domains